jgi:hypothetical protein
MEKETIVQQENAQPVKEEKKVKNLCIGLDCGTMNLCCARNDSSDIKITRNVFLQVNKDEVQLSELTDINYVKSDDGEIFIIGEDAFKFANIFGKEVSRPMENGLISAKEIYAIDVLTMMIKDLIGDVKDVEAYCSYSVPAEAIDESRSVTYHEKVFGRILNSLGVNHTPVNEGAAIVYSECQAERFSGIGISFGAGMANCCIMYKGIEVVKFSTARSGDWIDRSVAESLNMVQNRVTSVKERNLDLTVGYASNPNKKIRRVLEALEYYYNSLVNYTIKQIIEKFEEDVDIEPDIRLPIVISGGTSMPPGFLQLFKSTVSKYELPFEYSEVRQAKNPLTAVAQGLLIKTISDIGK